MDTHFADEFFGSASTVFGAIWRHAISVVVAGAIGAFLTFLVGLWISGSMADVAAPVQSLAVAAAFGNAFALIVNPRKVDGKGWPAVAGAMVGALVVGVLAGVLL